MFKKTDYIIITIIGLFLGIFIVSQYYSGKEYSRVVQPETNETIALEVAKLTKTNASLRREIQDLTEDLDLYRNTSESSIAAYNKFQSDYKRLSVITGESPKSGQGVTVDIKGKLSTPQVVDLINALKNIGSEVLAINGERVLVNTDLGRYSNQERYQIIVVGNSKLLKSAMERRGGVVDQIQDKDVEISITEYESITVPAGAPINYLYAKIISEEKEGE